jgi:hypothetical protein
MGQYHRHDHVVGRRNHLTRHYAIVRNRIAVNCVWSFRLSSTKSQKQLKFIEKYLTWCQKTDQVLKLCSMERLNFFKQFMNFITRQMLKLSKMPMEMLVSRGTILTQNARHLLVHCCLKKFYSLLSFVMLVASFEILRSFQVELFYFYFCSNLLKKIHLRIWEYLQRRD